MGKVDRIRGLVDKALQTWRREGWRAVCRKILGKLRRRWNTTTRLRKRHQETLRRILAAGTGKGVVIFFPTVDWGWMVQRPHQLIREFARKGYVCFFVTAQTRVDVVDGFQQVADNLYLCADMTLLQEIPRPIVLLSSTYHVGYLSAFKRPTVIYDFLDALEVTAGGPVTEEKVCEHQALLQRADVVLATAQRLYEEAKSHRPDVLIAPNGADPAHFAPRRDRKVPADLESLVAKGQPIIGYYGALAEWFDYDLVAYAAEALADCQFVFLGPDYDGSIVRLPKRDNVHYLGLKSYDELPAYLQAFDVATIPFRINEITRSTSPVKLFEYMSGRKPIVTTAMDEAFHYQSVLVAESPAEFVAKLMEGLRLRTDAAYLSVLDRECAENTWSQRVDAIVAALEAPQGPSPETWIILAGVPIDDSGGGQRPAQIALELLARGCRVTYVSRFPKQESREVEATFTHPSLEHCDLATFDPSLYIDASVRPERLRVLVEIPHPDFLPAIRSLKEATGQVLYDLIDDWRTSLGGKWYRQDVERDVVELSDVLLASAVDLQDYLQELSQRPVALVPNAVNLARFRLDAAYSQPSDMIKGEGTILYVGALWGEWFDWELVRQTAEHMPKTSFILIGEHLDRCPYRPLPNMHLLGLKSQRDLPAYLAHSDVAIIPFKDSELTQAVSPLKVYEYLAMGMPVVATNLRELRDLPYVSLADTPAEFASLITAALQCSVEPEIIQDFRAANGWQSRVDVMLQALESFEQPLAASP